MNAETFNNELRKIYDETNEKVVALVNKAQAEDGFTWDTDKSASFANDSNWIRSADDFAEMTGWIYDRLRGKTRFDRGSMTKKIRKTLGYSYP